MSLTSDEMQRLQSYVRQNAEASALFEKLLLSYEMERHKICHEIRNPLTLLSSTIKLIESQHPEIRSFDYWNSLCEDLDYMMELLQEFSLYNNSNDLRPETFSFRNFMERLVLSFAASCTASDVEFTSRLQENLPVITGDPVKLRQAILNLLKNARESIHGPGSVRLDVWSKCDELHIRIEDTGCGITKGQMEEIFTPFVTTKSSGTGLGLPVVQNIIHAHHGTVSVTSIPNHGTTFEVLLPVHWESPDHPL